MAEQDADFASWPQRCDPVTDDCSVIVKGLPEQVQLKLLVGVQQRTDNGTKRRSPHVGPSWRPCGSPRPAASTT
jgi:hypothetical protein